MYDFFAAKESYLPTGTENPYADATGTQDPFPKGWAHRPTGKPIEIPRTAKSPDIPPVTAKFDPTDARDACRAWSTLSDYCKGAGEDCACYSGTYYVPDQWNSLANSCARVTSRCGGTDQNDGEWCQFGRTASSYSDYCPKEPSDDSIKSARFAQFANIDDEDESSGGSPAPQQDPEPEDPQPTKNEAKTTTSDEPVVEKTTTPGPTPVIYPAQTTTESGNVYIFSSGFPSGFPDCLPSCLPNPSPTDTGSSQSLNPLTTSALGWLGLFAAILFS